MAEPLAELRLLIVDDNKQMRTIIGTVLAAAGVRHLHYAADGKRALEVLAEAPVDCVFCDYEMPVMNGLEFVTRVRAGGANERFLPIVMLTGYSDLAHLNAARDCGVTEFLRKPVTARDVLLRLEAVIMRPRPFVTSERYFGPDRRRQRLRRYAGPLRRRTDTPELVEL